jgi:hypothetical protein
MLGKVPSPFPGVDDFYVFSSWLYSGPSQSRFPPRESTFNIMLAPVSAPAGTETKRKRAKPGSK